MNKKKIINLIILIVGITLYMSTLIFNIKNTLGLILYLVAYIIFGYPVIVDGVRKAIKSDIFSENTLMTIATVGAFAIGEYPEAVAVMLFYRIGEFLEDYAIDKSKDSIKELINIRPEEVNLVNGNDVVVTKPSEVRIGDIFVVRPGERVALDGIAVDGISSVDTSALTGESLPRVIESGNEVFAGSINIDGVIKIKATKLFEESFAAKIVDLVENSKKHKAKTDRFISKFSNIYTPLVVLLAVMLTLIPTLIYGIDSFSDWLRRALIFLVISCPCALVVSVPLAFFAGIGRASRRGILLKGSITIENLARAKNIAFDKTGTLTKGIFKVDNIETVDITKEELLEYAAHCEANSNHPIAKCIVEAYGKIDLSRVADVTEMPGKGVSAIVDNKKIVVGNKRILQDKNVEHSQKTGVYVLIDGVYKGFIEVSDVVKDNAEKVICEHKELNIAKTVILTGDDKKAAEDVAKTIKISSVFSKLLPENKVEKVAEIKKDGVTVFVGDGINDAPVLAEADVGIAMGAIGSDAAIEAADVVILDDDLGKVPEAVKLSRKTLSRAKQNIVLALGIKSIIIILGAVGLTSMWLAVIADVGVTLVAVANSIRK